MMRWRLEICNLESRAYMIVRWRCGVSLKDKKRSELFYSLLSIHSMAGVARCGRLRWVRHLERKSGDDWVSVFRNVEVVESLFSATIVLTVPNFSPDQAKHCSMHTVRNLGWATDWCGVIARCRYRGILGGRGGHCLPSSEWSRRSCIQVGPLYNRHSTHNLCCG